MKAASFEQRKITALAISSAAPSRPSGMFAAMDAELKGEPAAAAVRKNPSSRGVAVGPGATSLTRMRYLAASAAAVRVSECAALLLAL